MSQIPSPEQPNYRNGFRYDSQPRWFDFYNCRIMLPEQQRFFYIMPYMLSGPEVAPDRRGFYIYDGGNGGDDGSTCALDRFADTSWTASATNCDVRWGDGNVFTGTRIRARGPSSEWDVWIEPTLTDTHEPEGKLRKFNVIERFLLGRVPFIHRVPCMKGRARGQIVQHGRRYSFDDAIVYQAKNHGHRFPDDWIWVYGNVFDNRPDLAFEAASLRTSTGSDATVFRVATPEKIHLLSSATGDELTLSHSGDDYQFTAVSKDGAIRLNGRARHRDRVVFRFPGPIGVEFENDESLVGELTLELNGERSTTTMAALGHAHVNP